jgi:hypothetical protein
MSKKERILTEIKEFAQAYNLAGQEHDEYFWAFGADEDNDEIDLTDLDEIVYRLCENDISKKVLPYVDGFEFEHIQQEGGGEGGAEYCYGVFKLNDKYYKAEYSYYSYNGYEFDDICDTLQEVFPVERLVTFYEPKQ